MSRSQDWVRIADAARVTGIPARTIRWWAARGRIPHVQIGGPRTWLLVYLPALTLPTGSPSGHSDRKWPDPWHRHRCPLVEAPAQCAP